MSVEFKQLDASILDYYRSDIEELLKIIYGSDVDIQFNVDGSADLKIVGGDLILTGASIGNGLQDLYNFVRNRVAIRLLSYYAETPLLPNGYGSYLTDVIGYSIIDDENFQSDDNVLKLSDVRSFVDAIVRFSLEFEPLVTRINNVSTEFENNTLYINVNFNSVFLNYISANLELVGE